MAQGQPPPATLSEIISNLFQNEKSDTFRILFSQCALTPAQKAQLTYPPNFVPLDIYIYYQSDPQTSAPQIISFAEKDDFIFGVYFNIFGQAPIVESELICSKTPVVLSDNIRILTREYLEVYQNVNGTTTILGHEPSICTLQFRRKCQYYYNALTSTGLQPALGTTYLTGLSRNLQKFKN